MGKKGGEAMNQESESLAQRHARLVLRRAELKHGTSEAQKAELRKVKRAITKIDRRSKRGG